MRRDRAGGSHLHKAGQAAAAGLVAPALQPGGRAAAGPVGWAAAPLRIAPHWPDLRSLVAATLGGALFLALAFASMAMVRADEAISPVWLPNAVAVAILLRARLRQEWPFILATFLASLASNHYARLPIETALLFSFANMVEIAAVVALVRRNGRDRQDMRHLSDLARFVWAGGLVGPLLSALVAAAAMAPDPAAMRAVGVAWFLADSMAMVLVVPVALLAVDRLRGGAQPSAAGLAESFALLVGGMTCALLVFGQTNYPLMFLIQPITLLHAFRLGSLGTALHVAIVAAVAAAMTVAGMGPIAAASGSPITQLHLLQAFVAANFLTGLPVAAILAGRNRMMAALAAGKRQVDLLADNITDAVLRFDLAGICTYASPSVREVLGAPPEAYVGRPVTDRLHPEARDRALLALARLIAGTSDKERLTYRRFEDRSDGTPVFLEADCAIVRNPETGAREGVVVAARDVTERVELELLLTRARRNAEHAAQAKSEFLANMSHEIRTPMNGVLGFAELMLQGELDPDQRRFAEMIVQSGRSMMLLLNDVLDLSKIESGQFAIDRAPVDLHTTLAECAALHRVAAERKGLALEVACDCSAEPGCRYDAERRPWVVTDGLRLRQIVLNLLGNAVKFTEAGEIRMTYRIEAGEVRVTVADTGIGISACRLETIFAPFTQGESDTARRFGGTGLGLSISRQLAQLLGGRIEVESEPGRGSRFTLVLPAVLSPPEVPVEPEPAAPARLLQASRILLVEDHDINRTLMTEMLERCGQEVEVAHDGHEGIAMVIEAMVRGRPFDLVLMDVQMPGCDGYAATRAIREEGIGPDELPVIALTANAFPEDIAAARAAGMQAHLAKPIVFAELARSLQRWLPTRIVESDPAGGQVPVRVLPDRLIERWEERRKQALAAVRGALASGALAGEGAVSEGLARLLHKLAGSAALFGEADLGETAGALERALRTASSAEERAALARNLLALGEEDGEPPALAAEARG